MYIIDFLKLMPGDIILTRDDSPGSLNIRKQSNAEYSHALIAIDRSCYIESDGLGVQAGNFQRKLFHSIDDAVALRMSTPLKENERETIEIFARLTIGTEYSALEARRAIKEQPNTAVNPNRQYCTRFVAQAYKAANINIVNNPDYCTAQEILTSTILMKVPAVVRIATNEEINFTKSNSILPTQTEITACLFEGINNSLKTDIQTFQQTLDYLDKHPEDDPVIANQLKASGYLSMWQINKQNNLWQYDYSSLKSICTSDEEIIARANFLIENHNCAVGRYFTNLITISEYYKRNKLETFKLFEDLYETLIHESMISHAVGEIALKNI
ncbi:MAG: hypothetical protein ACM3Q2_00320 [Syntrophothermus sp.]